MVESVLRSENSSDCTW